MINLRGFFILSCFETVNKCVSVMFGAGNQPRTIVLTETRSEGFEPPTDVVPETYNDILSVRASVTFADT